MKIEKNMSKRLVDTAPRLWMRASHTKGEGVSNPTQTLHTASLRPGYASIRRVLLALAQPDPIVRGCLRPAPHARPARVAEVLVAAPAQDVVVVANLVVGLPARRANTFHHVKP
jgi:hypothetical protein